MHSCTVTSSVSGTASASGEGDGQLDAPQSVSMRELIVCVAGDDADRKTHALGIARGARADRREQRGVGDVGELIAHLLRDGSAR